PSSLAMSLLTHSHLNTSRAAIASSPSQYKPFLDLIDEVHAQAEIARYLAISGIVLLIYDWLTTLDKEIKYTWGRRWTLARVVYHLNRVLPILLIGVVLIPNVLFAPAHFTPSGLTKEVEEINIRDRCKGLILSYSYGVIALLVIIGSTFRDIPITSRN
ncbi:unnamed protein product, partial [Rhizoctonia solani]